MLLQLKLTVKSVLKSDTNAETDNVPAQSHSAEILSGMGIGEMGMRERKRKRRLNFEVLGGREK